MLASVQRQIRVPPQQPAPLLRLAGTPDRYLPLDAGEHGVPWSAAMRAPRQADRPVRRGRDRGLDRGAPSRRRPRPLRRTPGYSGGQPMSTGSLICDVCDREEALAFWNDRIVGVTVDDGTIHVCGDCVTMGRL